MANVPISGLANGVAVSDTDLFPDVQSVGSGPVKVTGAQIKTYVLNNPVFTNISAQSISLTNSLVPYITTLKSSTSLSSSWNFTFPSSAGTNGYVLTTDGSGNTAWTNPTGLGIDIDVGSTSITGGTSGRVLYDNAGKVGEYLVVPVGFGGTGHTVLTQHGVLIGNAGNAINSTVAGSAGQVLSSGGASADPVWTTATFPSTASGTGAILRADGTNWSASTSTYPDTTTAGTVLVSAANNTVSASANPTIGVQQTTQGSLVLANTAAGAFSTTLKSSNSSIEAWTLTLPVSKGSSGYILTTDGTGTSSWTNPTALGIDIDVNSTAITSGTSGRIVYDNAGTFGEISAITTNGSDTLTVGVQQTTQGSIVLANTAVGAFSTTVKSSNSASAAWTLTLPTTAGTNNYVLTTNGSGTSSWSQVSLTAGVIGVLPAANGGTGQSSNTIHGVLIGNAGNAINATTAGSSGQVLQSGGAGADPNWTTATFPSTATGTGTILRADGTNWSATTATYPTTTGAGTLLISGTDNTVTASATPTLGIAGSTVGTLSFANATSGSVQLSPATGALGSSVITMPATTGTMTVLGNTVTGSGSIVLATSPSLTTPALGVATGTSLALGGATIGTDAFAVTGTATMGSATYFPTGTAAAPSIGHVANTNCGIFLDTNIIGFAANGSEIARINTTGLGVGVGPSYKLHVLSSVAVAALIGKSGANGSYFYNDASDAYIGSDSSVKNSIDFNPGSNYVAILTNNSEKIRVTTAGNLLIGTTSTATSAAGTIHIYNGTAPSASLTNGGVLYVESGALKYRGSGGTITTLGAA